MDQQTSYHHPCPYKLLWLDNKSDIKIDKQALIAFKIGTYEDQIMFDVCPMDACHILLGRPWQFDRFAQFDGRSNTYTIKRHEHDKTLTWKPFKVMDSSTAARVINKGLLLSTYTHINQLRSLRSNSFEEGEDDTYLGYRFKDYTSRKHSLKGDDKNNNFEDGTHDDQNFASLSEAMVLMTRDATI